GVLRRAPARAQPRGDPEHVRRGRLGARGRDPATDAGGRGVADRVPQASEGLVERLERSRRTSATATAAAAASASHPHPGYEREGRAEAGTESVPAGGASRRQMPRGEELYSRSSAPPARPYTGARRSPPA